MGCCAFSPDGALLASGSTDRTLHLWEVATGRERAVLRVHDEYVNACAFSADGATLLTASNDRTLKLWDVAIQRVRATLRGHTDAVDRCAFSPDGRLIASGSHDHTARLWDARTGEPRAVLRGHTKEIQACIFSPDGQTLLTTFGDETLKLWEVATGQERATLRSQPHDFTSASGTGFSPDGTRILWTSYRTLILWDTHDLRAVVSQMSANDAVGIRVCAFSPDGNWLVNLNLRKQIELRDAATGTVRAALALPGELSHLALHPWQPLAVCGNDLGRVYVVELVGVAYGPLIVTATDRGGGGPAVRCPVCGQATPVARESLGGVVRCAQGGCGARLRVNPFVIGAGQA